MLEGLKANNKVEHLNNEYSAKVELEKMMGRSILDGFVQAVSTCISPQFFQTTPQMRFNKIFDLLITRSEKWLIHFSVDTYAFLIASLKSYNLLHQLQDKLKKNHTAVTLVGGAIFKYLKTIENKLKTINIVQDPDFIKGIAAFVSWDYFDKTKEQRFVELGQLMENAKFRQLLLDHRENGKKFLIWSTAKDEDKLESFKQQSISGETEKFIDECLNDIPHVTYSSAPSVRLMLYEFWRTITGRPFPGDTPALTLVNTAVDEEKGEYEYEFEITKLKKKADEDEVSEQKFITVFTRPVAETAAATANSCATVNLGTPDAGLVSTFATEKFKINVIPPSPLKNGK